MNEKRDRKKQKQTHKFDAAIAQIDVAQLERTKKVVESEGNVAMLKKNTKSKGDRDD